MEEKKKYRIIIAGGRHFQDYETLREQVESVFEKRGIVREEAEIISGHAAGVDQLGERFAKENGILCTVFSGQLEQIRTISRFQKKRSHGEICS